MVMSKFIVMMLLGEYTVENVQNMYDKDQRLNLLEHKNFSFSMTHIQKVIKQVFDRNDHLHSITVN